MKQNYHVEDYRFTPTNVFYQGEYISTFQLVKHLNHWWPGVNWKRWSLRHYYSDLKRCLECRIIFKVTMAANNNKQKYNIEDYSFTPSRPFYQGEFLKRSSLIIHVNFWLPSLDCSKYYYIDLKYLLEVLINAYKEINGSNRLCICDGMDECLSRTEEKTHETRAANNE